MRQHQTQSANRRTFLKTIPALALSAGVFSASGARAASRAMPFVDGLSFLPEDPADAAESGLTAFIADVSAGQQVETSDGSVRFRRTFEACTRSIVAARQRLRDVPGLFVATRGSEIPDTPKKGSTAVFFQFQGMEPMGEDLLRFDLFYELGLRILQVTHHNDNPFGGGAIEKNWTGLTKLGFEAVEHMNELGIIPDLAHASDLTSLDVLKTSRKPVILSHGAARALVNNARCAPDEVIRGVADSGGAMGIFMMSFWLTSDPEPSIDSYLQQIRHVIKVGGISAVAVANDFSIAGQMQLAKLGNNNEEGVKGYFPWWDSVARQGVLGFAQRPRHVVIPELNDVKRMFTIQAALEKDGFSQTEVEKIMGGNWIRVLRESLG